MQADKFTVTGSWHRTQGGHVFEATARTTDKANRTIRAVESSVLDMCRQMALLMPG